MIMLITDIENYARAVNECGKIEKSQSQTLEKLSVFIQSLSDAKRLSIIFGFR